MTFSYRKLYEIFKKMPLINFISTMLLAFVWAIFDAVAEITELGDLGVGAVFIWLIIGGVAAAIVSFFTALCISATVVRTDATLEILASVKNGSSNSSTSTDSLPEL
ncbi:MAG: hypothetical protein IKD45_03875 [Clostridia bacterium]|nr:hypothetical protein [Clostridia bacterium]